MIFIHLSGRLAEAQKTAVAKAIDDAKYKTSVKELSIAEEIYLIWLGEATDTRLGDAVCVDIRLGKGEPVEKRQRLEAIIRASLKLKKNAVPIFLNGE